MTTKEMWHVYNQERKTLEEIGKISGMSRQAVHKRFQKKGFQCRSRSECQLGRVLPKLQRGDTRKIKRPTKFQLKKWRSNYKKVMEYLNCSRATAYRILGEQ